METNVALFIFGVCGLISVLVDGDHFLALLIWRYWKPTFWNGRFLHTPILAGAGVIVFGCCAYWGGLHIGLVLGL